MNISYTQVVDLSHTLAPGIPVWPGDPEPALGMAATVERDGYLVQRLTIGEHSGTHLGCGAHFDRSGVTMDSLPPAALVRPAVVIDFVDRAAHDPDARLSIEEIVAWELEHGDVSPGSVVLLYTGWSDYWNDRTRYFGGGREGELHFPGFGLDAARFLAESRGVTGLGVDTHGIDGGIDSAFTVNTFWLRGDRFHLENLTSLGRLPATGATLFIGALKIVGGSGAPARVLAIW